MHKNWEKLEAVALKKTVFLSVFCLTSRDWTITIEFNFSVGIVFMVMKKWSEKKCDQETQVYWNSEQHRNSVRIKDKNK